MPYHPDDSHADAPAPGDRPDHTVDVRDASASKADPFAGAPGASSASLEKPGDQIGPYKLISMLGEGGFGEVWLAERKQPFTQQVALKVIKAGMDSKAVIGRFEQERQALAVMNHPHVAKVLDGGLTPQGRPYFAMEYVKGEPITDFCDRQKLSIKDRLRLFMQVCEAIQHAHTKGIIHRDLKPGNVLVGLASDDTPQAKVIDFGVAKALTQRMTEKTVFTETGQMIGTPLYMSPEQADPTDQDIDTRSDIYSLGVILYELLAGATPFDLQDLRSRAYREVQRMIREQDPPTPSARLSTIATKDTALASKIAEARKDAAATLTRTLRSELEWIPLKAMRKERKERYDTPADLARDVQNYLEGGVLEAGPVTWRYRFGKWLARREITTAIALICAAWFLIPQFQDSPPWVSRERLVEAPRWSTWSALDELPGHLLGSFFRYLLPFAGLFMLWSRLVIGRQTSALSRLSTAGFTFIPTLAVIMVLSRYFGAVARWQEGEHSISALELALGSLGVLVVAGVVFLGPLCIALLIRASIWRTYLTFLLTLASVQAFMICLQINVESMHRAHRWSESLKELRRDRVTEQWCLVDAKEGKVSEAIAKLQPILAARRRGLGDDSELTIALTANLGALLTFSDRLAEAEPLIMEAVERRRHLDPDHPASLTTTFYIGALRARQGRHAEAELALTHALAGFSRTLGTNDNMATSCTAELINLHRRWDEADPGRGHAATAAALQAQLDAKKTLSEAPEDVTASPKP